MSFISESFPFVQRSPFFVGPDDSPESLTSRDRLVERFDVPSVSADNDDEDDALGGNGGNVSDLNLELLVLLTPIRVDSELLEYLFLSASSRSYRELLYELVKPLLVSEGRYVRKEDSPMVILGVVEE